jgi:hypothetical protein
MPVPQVKISSFLDLHKALEPFTLNTTAQHKLKYLGFPSRWFL